MAGAGVIDLVAPEAAALQTVLTFAVLKPVALPAAATYPVVSMVAELITDVFEAAALQIVTRVAAQKPTARPTAARNSTPLYAAALESVAPEAAAM